MTKAGSEKHRTLVGVKHKTTVDITEMAKALCEKLVDKVESRKARSHVTYAECKALLKAIYREEDKNADKSGG